MKLFHKIFLCFVVVFGITFQAAGFLLINYSYENVMAQQQKSALQDYQYNRYILQSILYSGDDFFLRNKNNYEAIQRNFTVPVSLSGRGDTDYEIYYPGIDMLETKVWNEKGEIDHITTYVGEKDGERIFFSYAYNEIIDEGKVTLQTYEKDGRHYIFAFGFVRQGEGRVNMITQTDVSAAVDSQRSMMVYFQRMYLIILCLSFPVIFFLTKVLTSPIRKVGEAAGSIAGGNYSQRIQTKGKDEISDLAEGFNDMAQQVEDKIAQLSDMVRQKEDFTANFAHELKTPMTSVIGYADMLYQRELPREEVKKAAEYILDEGMRLEALSLKLMDLFVLDRQDFLLEEMSVPLMFENMRQGIEPLCEKYGATLHMEFEEGMIRVDFDLFKTLILNLADNAVKAGSKDLWISGGAEEDCYRIIIRDNGRGIPREELGRITEAFYMVDKSRSRKQHGAGLGMALAAKIAENHGAKMEIDSDGKTGTVICLTFVRAEGGRDEENI